MIKSEIKQKYFRKNAGKYKRGTISWEKDFLKEQKRREEMKRIHSILEEASKIKNEDTPPDIIRNISDEFRKLTLWIRGVPIGTLIFYKITIRPNSKKFKFSAKNYPRIMEQASTSSRTRNLQRDSSNQRTTTTERMRNESSADSSESSSESGFSGSEIFESSSDEEDLFGQGDFLYFHEDEEVKLNWSQAQRMRRNSEIPDFDAIPGLRGDYSHLQEPGNFFELLLPHQLLDKICTWTNQAVEKSRK